MLCRLSPPGSNLRWLARLLLLLPLLLPLAVAEGCSDANSPPAPVVQAAAPTDGKELAPHVAEAGPDGSRDPASDGQSGESMTEPPDEADDSPKAGDDSRNTAHDSPKANESRDPAEANHLAGETSPYLLQHAHNPVDWYPWGEGALAKARRENKIIFLSVGYSSCHWCHVMERESFMDKEIAAYLNEHFVCIKVDREERPDVDSIYMTAVQIISRRGGWPMSVFLTPDAKPFFGGTYFPARDNDRPGITGFYTLLQTVQKVWGEQPERLREDADRLTEMIKSQLAGRAPQSIQPLDSAWLDDVQLRLAEEYDSQYGGFGFAEADPNIPKFPEPSNLFFLIDRLQRLPDDSQAHAEARKLLVGSLERMAMGGIRDHLGGGFHRYSVDRYWRIPHFEKMLYDNGQLATVYSEAYRLTGREDFRLVVEQLLDFVLREMTSEEGGFYSALDAESEHEEGKFYRWEKAELERLLEPDEFALLAGVYGLAGQPNFEEEFYVPQLARPAGELAEARELSLTLLEERLRPIRAKLLAARNERPRPLTDDKILTGWNGLMIRGFADAGRLLDQPAYIQAAERAARFVLDKLRDDNGRLLRTYGRGRAKLNAYLNDYAFLVDGLVALHQATGRDQWLQAAEQLTDKQIELFWDDKEGGFFFTSDDHESLLSRIRQPFDGAQPAGGSVATLNLLYLSQARQRPDFLTKAERTIQASSGLLKSRPLGAPRMAVAVARWLDLRDATNDPKPNSEPASP